MYMFLTNRLKISKPNAPPSHSRRLAVFTTHPIQYQAPVWRKLAQTPRLDVVVHYFSDRSIRGGIDPGFGVQVAWDVDLLDGYRSVFLNRTANIDHPSEVRITDPNLALGRATFDWVLICGYTHAFERQLIRLKKRYGYRVVMRGDFSDERGGLQVGGFNARRLRSLARDAYLRWFYSHIDAFGVVGVAAMRHLDRLGISAARQFPSPRSVDTDLFAKQALRFQRQACREELGIPADRFVVLFSGKFVPGKAPMLLLEAVAGIGGKERVTLIMIGDGELRPEMEQRFRPLMGRQLLMPGFVNQSQLGRYFAAADVFVLPSEWESWGLVVNEAMQFGLPVIVSDRVVCRHDLVIPGETGEVFAVGNVEGLTARLDTFMRNSAWTQSLGANCRRHIEKYSSECAANGLLKAIGII